LIADQQCNARLRLRNHDGPCLHQLEADLQKWNLADW
jgi:hypothetical protein